jgi:hypothetical protein
LIWVAVLAVAGSCGDDRDGPPRDAGLIVEAGPDASGSLFGEACTQPPAPTIGVCHGGDGACHDEPGGAVCRPFCAVDGEPRCDALGGLEAITDRGACVCVPRDRSGSGRL